MKNLIVFIFFLSTTFQLSSQITLEGTVVEVDSKDPIPYSNIGIVQLAKGTVSDIYGRYVLDAEKEADVVIFSSLGYESKEYTVNELQQMDTVYLSPISYDVDVITIEAQKFQSKEIQLGVKNKKRGHSIGFGSPQLGTEIGAAIRIKKQTYVKSANFVLNHAKGDSLLFRVNIYDFKEGKVGENILKENIFIRERQKKGVVHGCH